MNLGVSFSTKLYLGLALASFMPTIMVSAIAPSVQAQETETIIHVNPDSGNDDSADGSKEQPYQTLTEALAAAQRNAVIKLAPGTYSEETGEQFPIVVRRNVEIRGTPNNQGNDVQIKGGGLFRSPTGAGQQVGIALLADATLTGVSVTNQRDRGHGVWVEGASPTVTHSSFRGNDSTGLSVNGFGKPRISENYFNQNAGNGIVIYGRSEPIIENNTFDSTGFGISMTQQTKPQLLDNEIKNNRIGIVIEGNAQPILRNNTITLSRQQGLVAISNSRPDLGTDQEPGGNVFRQNGQGAIKNSAKNFVIPAHGNEIAGSTEGEIDLTGTVANPMPEEPSRPRLQITRQQRSPRPTPSSSTEQIWTAPTPESSSSLSTDRNNPPLRLDGDIPTPVSSSELLPPQDNGSSGNAVRGEIQLTAPPNRSTDNNRTSNNSPNNPPASSSSQDNNNTPSQPPASRDSQPSNGGRASLDDILSLHSNSSQERANTSRNNNPPPQRNSNSLPVPSGNIPSGDQFRPGTSPEERAAIVGGEYRVIVEISTNSDRDKVKNVVPDAFRSRYEGRSVMQVGIFQSQENAEEIGQKLREEGLQVRVIPMNNN